MGNAVCIASAADTLAVISLNIAEGEATAANLRATASEFSRSNPPIALKLGQAADVISGLVDLVRQLEPK